MFCYPMQKRAHSSEFRRQPSLVKEEVCYDNIHYHITHLNKNSTLFVYYIIFLEINSDN